MTTEQAHSIFADIRTYLRIEHDTPTPVMFDEDEPYRTKIDSFGLPQHLFKVNGDEILAIGSNPLLRELKPHTPLSGKELVITRTGEGYQTRYTVARS